METKQHSSKGLNYTDGLIFLIIAVVGIATIAISLTAGVYGLPLSTDDKLSWHLVRTAGMTAYGLLGLSTVWGLFLSSRIIKDWSPGPMSLLFHATTSWLAVVFSFAHAGLLLFDRFYQYKLSDLLIPFTGPYRAFAVGLGTMSAWLVLAITISFSLRKLIGQKAWKWLHYTSYATFALVTIHAMLAGTDGSKQGMLIQMGLFVGAIVTLFTWRVAQSVLQSRKRMSKHASKSLRIQ